MGSVYSRKATKYLWIKYLQHGRVIRESTQTDNLVKARRMLRDREGDVEKGVPIGPEVGRITFDEAAADRLNDYSINRRKTYDDARRRIRKHLSPFFGNRRMITITTTELRAYVTKRLADGTPVGTSVVVGPRPKGLHPICPGARCLPPRSIASSPS